MKANFLLNSDFLGKHLTVVPNTVKTDFDVNGSNQKHLMIVYLKSDKPFNVSFLEKILKAVKYNLTEDVALIGITPEDHFRFSDWQEKFTPQHVIVLGLTPQQIAVHLNHQLYTIQHCSNADFLFTDELTDIESDQSKKAALWGRLKEMFL